ncbi:SDR family oxidoreductase [Mucilaginibacter endophyticus]|uniref:SDR family oxidoreductase n=1 Tax=Mucilaginibacter endophyticus TaxID=2675003 RepID=UPI001ABFD2E4|nr:SDR family oxidoreductase [Mucilaginibacter endophyticus]
MMKTIFITGAASGIGKATATYFHSMGWHVIASMRNTNQAGELENLPNVTLKTLDVVDNSNLESLVAEITALYSVDVVVNNAGYGLIGPIEGTSDDQITKQLNTNLLGTINVTKAFIPYFRSKGSGIFINISSMGGVFSFPLNAIYHATKWGIEGFSESLAFELKLCGVKVKTVAPGSTRTGFFQNLEFATHPDYKEALDKVFQSFDEKHFSDPSIVAEVIYEAATDNKDQLRYLAGEDVNFLYNKWKEIGREAFHMELQERIFGKTQTDTPL